MIYYTVYFVAEKFVPISITGKQTNEIKNRRYICIYPFDYNHHVVRYVRLPLTSSARLPSPRGVICSIPNTL